MRSKPKILIINTTDTMGGAASVAWRVGEDMRRRGYSVKYLVSRKYSDSPHVQALDSDKHHWLSMLLRYGRSFLLANDIDYGDKNIILKHPWYKEADIVHLHNLHGSYFPLDLVTQITKDKKVIWTLHDMWPICGDVAYSSDPKVWQEGRSGLSSRREYPYFLFDNSRYLWSKKREIYKNIRAKVVTPSHWLKQVIADKSIISHLPCKVIANGVDTSYFCPGNRKKLRSELGIPRESRVIIFVASSLHDHRKGWHLVKKSAKNNPNLTVIAVGAKRNTVQDNIHYYKRMDQERLLSYLQASDAVVIAAKHENLSLAIIEAMSVGLPIIGYIGGGTKELVADQKGNLTTTSRTIKAIRQVLNRFNRLSDKQLSQIGNKNRNIALNKFDVGQMCDNYAQEYQELYAKKD